jgi:hypothetical protein
MLGWFYGEIIQNWGKENITFYTVIAMLPIGPNRRVVDREKSSSKAKNIPTHE